VDTFCIKITKIVYKERDFNLLIIEIESIEVLENKNKKSRNAGTRKSQRTGLRIH